MLGLLVAVAFELLRAQLELRAAERMRRVRHRDRLRHLGNRRGRRAGGRYREHGGDRGRRRQRRAQGPTTLLRSVHRLLSSRTGGHRGDGRPSCRRPASPWSPLPSDNVALYGESFCNVKRAASVPPTVAARPERLGVRRDPAPAAEPPRSESGRPEQRMRRIWHAWNIGRRAGNNVRRVLAGCGHGRAAVALHAVAGRVEGAPHEGGVDGHAAGLRRRVLRPARRRDRKLHRGLARGPREDLYLRVLGPRHPGAGRVFSSQDDAVAAREPCARPDRARPCDGRRGPAEIAAGDPDLVGLLYMRRGTIGLHFEGEPVALHAGELVMWDSARHGGFRTFGRVDNQTLVVPRERLATGGSLLRGDVRSVVPRLPSRREADGKLPGLAHAASSAPSTARHATRCRCRTGHRPSGRRDARRPATATADGHAAHGRPAVHRREPRQSGSLPGTIAKANAISPALPAPLVPAHARQRQRAHSRAQAQPLPCRSAARHGRAGHRDRLPMGLSQHVVLQPRVS